jgi:S-DNA-T family DNA segregation ATPase FtsK/SpoIIIE
MVSDHDVHAIADHWRAQGAPQYEPAIRDKMEKKTTDIPDMEEDEEIIDQAIEIIRQTRRASTSSLQRRLRIGYTRAARVMDLLEERGIVGPAQGSDPREILIDLEGDIPQNPNAPPADVGGESENP